MGLRERTWEKAAVAQQGLSDGEMQKSGNGGIDEFEGTVGGELVCVEGGLKVDTGLERLAVIELRDLRERVDDRSALQLRGAGRRNALVVEARGEQRVEWLVDPF